MPEIDSVTGLLTMPWWMAAVVAACIVGLFIFVVLRNGVNLAGLAWLGVIALGLALGWNVHERFAARDRADERRALDARVADHTLRMTAPGSPLACIGTTAGDAVEAACEKALFASPESAAAAVAYAEARLSLLTDAADFAARGNDYEHALVMLRRPVEADRFGFFAHAFSGRQNCSADNCDAAELLLQDPTRIVANLKEGTFQNYVSRHAASWGQPAGPALASTGSSSAAAATPAAPVATSTVNFPSAESIPPVSIMNNEPGMPGQNGMDTAPSKQETAKPPAQARRSAPAKQRAAEPPAPAGSPGFPVPIAPPRPAAASSGAAPSNQ